MIVFDDTREMERRASMCYADGLLDIGIGIGLLILGFGMLFGLGAVAVVYWALIFSLMRSAKRIVTVPRMHHLDFIPEPDAERRLNRAKAVVAAALAALLALGVVALFMSRLIPGHISAAVRENGIVIFGLALTALFALIAWGTAEKRPRAYAALALLILVFGYWFSLGAAWYVMIMGAVSVSCGSSALARFVRGYPRFHGTNGKAYQRIS
jgi:hypothetical protein